MLAALLEQGLHSVCDGVVRMVHVVHAWGSSTDARGGEVEVTAEVVTTEGDKAANRRANRNKGVGAASELERCIGGGTLSFDGPPSDAPPSDAPPSDGPPFDGPPLDGTPFDGPRRVGRRWVGALRRLGTREFPREQIRRLAWRRVAMLVALAPPPRPPRAGE